MTMEGLSEYRPRDDLEDANFELTSTLTGHTDSVPAVRFSPDGTNIASGSADATGKVWDVESGKLLNNLSDHKHGLSDLSWNWDGVTLATSCDDCITRLWDLRTPGKAVRELVGHTHHVTSCSFAASGNMLATGSFDETLRLWDVRNGQAVSIIPAHSDPIMSVQFSTENVRPLVASASLDGTSRIWASHTGECVRTIVPDNIHHTPLVCARFTPNNKYILLNMLNSTIQLYDFNADKSKGKDPKENNVCLKKTYSQHLNQRVAVQSTFMVKTTDGSKLILSGSEDHHVYMWDLNSRVCRGILRGKPSREAEGHGHCDVVLGVEASSVQPLIVTAAGSGDCTVKIWRQKKA